MSRLLSCVLVFVAVWGSLHCLNLGALEGAWERSGKFEGDIVFKDGKGPKNGVLDPLLYWPNRTLPYKIASHFDSTQKAIILKAFSEYENKTCIRMREAGPDDTDYVDIKGTGDGCFSGLGKEGGAQDLNLQFDGCMYHGTIVHELLHALGFYHQQSATNRDDFVTIIWKNIENGTEDNFEKYNSSVITDFNVTYDYGSIMHYGATAFSINDEPTIVPKDPNAVIGQRDGLSASDIKKLHAMYKC